MTNSRHDVKTPDDLKGHGHSPRIFLMNKAAFDKLAPADRQAFIEGAKEGTKASRAKADEDNAKGVEYPRGKGMTVIDDLDKARLVAALAPVKVNAQFEKELGKANLDRIRNYR